MEKQQQQTTQKIMIENSVLDCESHTNVAGLNQLLDAVSIISRYPMAK